MTEIDEISNPCSLRFRLQRHPVPIKAWFEHCLVLTYAVPSQLLLPLLPPGLQLDAHEGFGFVAVAMVQARDLRPTFLPRSLGQDFFLTGYRIFARFRTPGGRLLRGLWILRSDANRRSMVWGGNLLTHYAYRLATVVVTKTAGTLEIAITTPGAEADLQVLAHVKAAAEAPPPGSPFKDLAQARRFAGPLPFTFDYERETNSIIVIEGVRECWNPRPLNVEVHRITFLERPPFNEARVVLANAFYVGGIAYEWRRGIRHSLENLK